MKVNFEYVDPFDEEYNYLMRAEHLGRYYFAAENLKKYNRDNVEIDEEDLFDNYYRSLIKNIDGNYSYVYPKENKIYFNNEYKKGKSR